MRNAKKIALVYIVIMCMLCGCGAKVNASGYLQAILDNGYKNDSKAFVELKLGTSEEAAQIYQEGIDDEMRILTAGVGEISDEYVTKLRQTYTEMLGKVRYSVKEATKQEDGSYVVSVTYEQMNIYGPTMEAYEKATTQLYDYWKETGELPQTQEELTNKVLDLLNESLQGALENVQYDSSESTTVTVKMVDGVYTIDENDLKNLNTVLFDSGEVEEK